MSHKDGRVVLSAWVSPTLRGDARIAAKAANMEFSRWVERAVQEKIDREEAKKSFAMVAKPRTPPKEPTP